MSQTVTVHEDPSLEAHDAELAKGRERAVDDPRTVGDITLDRKLDGDEVDIYDVRTIAEVAQQVADADLGQGDAKSFLTDIDAGKIPGTEQLRARLDAEDISGARYARLPNGEYLFDDKDQYVIEEREVTEDQAEALVAVAEERETTRSITESAERGLKSLADTASFARDILAGKIPSTSELQARLRAEDISGRRYARKPNGDYLFEENGDYVTEERAVTEDQAEALVAVALERAEAQRITRTAEQGLKSLADTASFAKDILAGKIPGTEQLRARLDAEDISGARYARLPNGEYLFDDKDQYVIEEREVTEDQAEILVEVQAGIQKVRQELPDDIQDTLAGPLEIDKVNQEIQRVEAAKAGVQTEQDIINCERVLDQLESLRSAVDQANLLVSFGQILSDRQRPRQEAADLLNQNVSEDQAEANLVKELQFSLGLRTIAELGEKLLEPGVDPQAVAEAIKASQKSLGRDEVAKAQAEDLLRAALRTSTLLSYLAVFEDISIGDKKIDYARRLEALSKLPRVSELDGVDLFSERQGLIAQGEALLTEAQVALIRNSFADSDAATLVEMIDHLPVLEADEARAAYDVFIAARRRDKPEDYRVNFAEESRRVDELKEPKFLESLGLGRNLEAFKQLSKGFKRAILPLYKALAATSSGKDLEEYVRPSREAGQPATRDSYTIELERLHEQRSVTYNEEEYLASVELLSQLNPHLVALAREEPDITRVFLRNHFDKLCAETLAGLEDGGYVPAVLIGTGPNGLTALGELLRTVPALADETLVVDQAVLIGGPLAQPDGEVLEMNSASEQGTDGPTLPESPLSLAQRTGISEEMTVRGYGSPLPFYPGERLPDLSVRPGSINTSIDYLLTPDDTSDSRYPTNYDAAMVFQLQGAMTISKLAMGTTVLDVRPAESDGQPGDKVVTLSVKNEDGVRLLRIRTDTVIVSSGLGEPFYGFDTDAPECRARQVLQQNDRIPVERMPLLSDALTAFAALGSREGTPVADIGDEVVIWGDGNSTDTLLENLGGILDTSNPAVRKIKRITVVAMEEPSLRVRYARIQDILKRNGKEGLVEVVKARVGDVELTEDGEHVRVMGTDGRPIVDAAGRPIVADSAIAATGFRPNLEAIFSNYLGEGQTLRDSDALESVVLPTNRKVAVADRLAADPGIVIVGTASRAAFGGEKDDQLPPEARKARLNNGADNAVAIGFRTPDTRAATRLLVEDRREQFRAISSETRLSAKTVTARGNVTPKSFREIEPPANNTVKIRRDARGRELARDGQLLTPLLLHSLGGLRLSDASETDVGQGLELAFRLAGPDESGRQRLTYEGSGADKKLPISDELFGTLAEALSNPYIQAYIRKAPSLRRSQTGDDKAYTIVLKFRFGKLDLTKTFIEQL